jgi:hypothetical protein
LLVASLLLFVVVVVVVWQFGNLSCNAQARVRKKQFWPI